MSQEGRLSAHQRERQQQRQARRTRRKARRGLLRWIALATIGFVALALIVGTMLPNLVPTGGATQTKALSAKERANGPGEHLVDQGANHIPEGTAFNTYNSTPPTSGSHWPVPARWGIYPEPLPNERQLHNLEHGGVNMQYNTQDQALIENLKTLAQAQRAFPACLIVAPYTTMEHPIALTAWGVMLTLDQFDKKQIEEFVKFYRDQGPERLSCQDIGQPQ
ncbi:MAG: DUF3105 domain-containing protein [Dehalococcoidia bacterium]|nr:DUF3105 domain-containing protein [Dehalococcoidia bacterium]